MRIAVVHGMGLETHRDQHGAVARRRALEQQRLAAHGQSSAVSTVGSGISRAGTTVEMACL